MKFLIQVCKDAKLDIERLNYHVSINKGIVVFASFSKDDKIDILEKFIDKFYKLRIFDDSNEQTNLSLLDVNGDILFVPQFTLYACCSSNRPSFTNCMEKEQAKFFFEKAKELLINKHVGNGRIEFGIFKEHMNVNLTNDGPFTIILDSKEILK